jgi:hypothetical protein
MSGHPRLLWLPHTLNPAYAGPRLRCLLPASVLRRQGVRIEITDQQPDTRTARFDATVVQAKWLLDADDDDFARRADAVQALKARGSRIVFDSFDNYFLNETADPQRQRRLESYRQVLQLADTLVVSSPGLVPLLERELPRPSPVRVVGDPVERRGDHVHYDHLLRRLNPRRLRLWLQARRERVHVHHARSQALQLLWFGNQGSGYARGGMVELEPLLPWLAACHRNRPLQLNVVSNSRPRYEQVMAQAAFPHRYSEWCRLSFPQLLAKHDLVLLPNRETDFTRAKSNNRLLLALAQGVPVMADVLPDYQPWQPYFAPAPWSGLGQVLEELDHWRARAQAARGPLLRSHGLPAIAAAWHAVLLRESGKPSAAAVPFAGRAHLQRPAADSRFGSSLPHWQPTR